MAQQFSFDSVVFEGDASTIERDGFTLTATVYRDDCNDRPDQNDDGFWPSRNPDDAGYLGDGHTNKQYVDAQAKAQERMAAWERGDWFYVGVDVVVSKAGVDLTEKYAHALWGIESDCGSHVADCAEDFTQEAIDDAKAKLAELAA